MAAVCPRLSILAVTFSCCVLFFVILDSEIVPALSTRALGAISLNVNRKDLDVHLRIFRLVCKRDVLILLLQRCPHTTTNMCPHTTTTWVLILLHVSASYLHYMIWHRQRGLETLVGLGQCCCISLSLATATYVSACSCTCVLMLLVLRALCTAVVW